MDNKKLIRKSYFCNDEVNQLVKEYSSSMGVSESAFINICIDNYNSQKIAVRTMGNLEEIMDRLEKLEHKKN